MTNAVARGMLVRKGADGLKKVRSALLLRRRGIKVDWIGFASNLISRIPIEKVLLLRPDNTKALQDFASKMEPPKSPTPQRAKTALQEPPPTDSGVSDEETLAYQKRELGKLLYQMERHYAQKLRINGIPCDCGSQKHLLGIEALSEETIPMVANPQVYYRLLEWVKKVGPTSTDEAAKSGRYDEEYPTFSHEARDFRKEIIGSLDPQALFPQKPGEPVGSRILPVVSDQEREEIKQKAIKKIDEVLGR